MVDPLNGLFGQVPTYKLNAWQASCLRYEFANSMAAQMKEEGWPADAGDWQRCLAAVDAAEGDTVLEFFQDACRILGISVPSSKYCQETKQ